MEELDQDLIEILEARKQRLQELKEEMKDVLFEEFILKQGDFMNVDVKRKENKRHQINNRAKFNLEFHYIYITEEEYNEFSKNSRHNIEQKYNTEIQKLKNQGRSYIPKLGYGPNGVNNDIIELEKNRDKEILEYDNSYMSYNNIIKRNIEKEIEYQKLEKEMITNNEIFIHFGSNIEEAKKEFEKKFWNYISQNGGFKNGCCSKCGKVPIIDRESIYFNNDKPCSSYIQGLLEHREIHEDFSENGIYVKQTKVIRSGKIKYIHCCKFLYDFEEKKMYKIGSPGKKYSYGSPVPMLHQTKEFIECEEYDFKTKKDLYEEMQAMKASLETRLLKLERLLNF